MLLTLTLKKEVFEKMDLRDSLLIDIGYELDNVDFHDSAACDNSYEYIRTNLLIGWENKAADEGSINETKKEKILHTLDNKSGDLWNCYLKLIEHLEKN